MPSFPRRIWIMVRAQARTDPIRMDWAWVSVPKYSRVVLAVGL